VELFEALQPFIMPHPVLHPEAGDIYTPNDHVEIRFFFEDGSSVTGTAPDLEINFNSERLLILATKTSVFRFWRTSLVGFELIAPNCSPEHEPQLKGLRLVASER
jgi:hypothetical protein